MDKRTSGRIILSLQAELIADSKSYSGIIENLSGGGACLEATTAGSELNLAPGKKVMLKLHDSSNETINLNCEVKHSNSIKNVFKETIYKTGLEINDPPYQYKAFLKTLE
jgi:hypothetical protein